MQRGAALFVSLVFLVILTLLGVAAFQSATLQEKMTGNLRDQSVAFQSAEAALRDGESVVAASLNTASPADYACTNGLCRPTFCDSGGTCTPVAGTPQWQNVSWAPSSTNTVLISSSITGVAQQPRYVIEMMNSFVPDSGSQKSNTPSNLVTPFRVTAVGWGSNVLSRSTLQSVYLKQ
ncbi:type IV fimbrial biogenesis protein PilX [Sulfuriferula multivorans]|uniref:Type IV fimbrial biogenesis protein PilX n=1 Tax=Sulfuriferula multivorans TaxID=1559896 RepID=A0A401JA72_9PROT|nr:type IV fimbrial biogenesis protein PilX [Sulfuriferula multivorans]